MSTVSWLQVPGEGVMFGRDIPGPIDSLLQQAVSAYEDTERAESLLDQAYRLDPDQLEVYIARYKFYFYKLRLEEAEAVAREALQRAADQGGFDPDWARLTSTSANWSAGEGPERIYLYTLKALGFIRLRRMDFAGGEAILDKLAQLDPEDQVGGSVLIQLAEGLREQAEENDEMNDDPLAQRVEAERVLGQAACAALQQELVKLGLADEIRVPSYEQAQFSFLRDTGSGKDSLLCDWLDAREHRCGQILIHADGSFWAEFDVIRAHPTDQRWFVDAVTAWGNSADAVKSEPRLMAALD